MLNRWDRPNKWGDFVVSKAEMSKIKAFKTWKEIIAYLGTLGKKRRATKQAAKRDSEQ